MSSYKDWDVSPEELRDAYYSKCALEKSLRSDIKDYKRIIVSLAGSKEKAAKAIDDWYEDWFKSEELKYTGAVKTD